MLTRSQRKADLLARRDALQAEHDECWRIIEQAARRLAANETAALALLREAEEFRESGNAERHHDDSTANR